MGNYRNTLSFFKRINQYGTTYDGKRKSITTIRLIRSKIKVATEEKIDSAGF